jgi:hypothetical protein
MSALRRRELANHVADHQCESCGGSAASLALVLAQLEHEGFTVAGIEDEREHHASLFEHSAGVRELVDRAHGTGWCLIASADGVVVVLSKSKRQQRRDAVQTIMRLHAQGKGPCEIARTMTERDIPTARGAPAWTHGVVRGVIRRETARTATAQRQAAAQSVG